MIGTALRIGLLASSSTLQAPLEPPVLVTAPAISGSPYAGAVLQVLQAYARAGAGRVPDLRPFLQRLLPRLRAVLWLVGWSPRLRGSREARRLRTVLDGMSAFVADRAQA